ncbi:hypothetical protein HPB47_011599 [Ixodes persulcatus]|uniref:Uncharacterized protein n=1 Tax=Ixodes persulcatus TaxID=34615 RepID=A0AC60NW67_IXOPE|nr:hypothetical protein HPB47_011599 [Ixodes persulcatus]
MGHCELFFVVVDESSDSPAQDLLSSSSSIPFDGVTGVTAVEIELGVAQVKGTNAADRYRLVIGGWLTPVPRGHADDQVDGGRPQYRSRATTTGVLESTARCPETWSSKDGMAPSPGGCATPGAPCTACHCPSATSAAYRFHLDGDSRFSVPGFKIITLGNSAFNKAVRKATMDLMSPALKKAVQASQ